MPNDAERLAAAEHCRKARALHMQGQFDAAIKWQEWAAAMARAERAWRG